MLCVSNGGCLVHPRFQRQWSWQYWWQIVIMRSVQMIRVDVTKYNKRFGIVKLNAKAYVGPDVVCEAELTLAMGS